MARQISLTFSLTTLLSLIHVLPITQSATAAAATTAAPASNFIRASCRATTYPTVCVQSLGTYASTIQKSPKQLITTALSVSVERARSTKTFVWRLSKFRGLKPREYAAIKDCLEEASDGFERLTKSARELKSMGPARGPEFAWHMSNLQTWVSAALTDDGTCLDGFAGPALNGRIKNSIRARMTNVAQVTSNALALCNKFAGN